MSFSIHSLLAATSAIIPIWPERLFPTHQEVVVERSADVTAPDRSYSGTYSPQLYMSWPEKRRAGAPAVLVCPGGGYTKVCLDKEGFEVARWLNDLGFVAAVLKYRLPFPGERPEIPVPMQDAVQAMRMLRENAVKWGLDESRIGIAGSSAGGHLAAMMATRFNDFSPAAEVRPAFQLLLYPVIQFHESATTHTESCEALLGRDAPESLKRKFSADLAAGPDAPPAFIVHAADDAAVLPDNSESYRRALEKAGVSARLLVLPAGGHGFGLGRKGGDPATWPSVGADWLRKTVLRLEAGEAASLS